MSTLSRGFSTFAALAVTMAAGGARADDRPPAAGGGKPPAAVVNLQQIPPLVSLPMPSCLHELAGGPRIPRRPGAARRQQRQERRRSTSDLDWRVPRPGAAALTFQSRQFHYAYGFHMRFIRVPYRPNRC